MSTLKEYVIAHVNPDEYYVRRFPNWNPRAKSNVRCPFHQDGGNPNLAVSLNSGGARCHSAQCGKRIGNIVHFEAECEGIKETIAARRLYRRFVRKVVPKEMLFGYRSDLADNPHYILKIRKEMGLSLQSIRQFQLGLDLQNSRVTIPVYDQFNQCVNIRYYKLPSERTSSDEAKIYNLKGYGRNDLFPWPAVESFNGDRPLFIMASEKEAMLAIQDGYNAISSTSGEDKFEAGWGSVTKPFNVILVLDQDRGGDAARKRIKPIVEQYSKSVSCITLPFERKRPDRKDYADWRLKEHHTSDELGKLVKVRKRDSTGKSISVSERKAKQEVAFPELPDFFDTKRHDIASISARSEFLNLRIHTQGIVAAKSPNTYSIPWRFKVKIKTRPAFVFSIPMGRELLRFVRASDFQILQSLQTLLGGPYESAEPTDYLTVTEVTVIPTAVADSDAPYTDQRCYYFGERIEANVPYAFNIIPTSEIRSQETIGIITNILPLSSSLDKFDFTPENVADLTAFAPSEGEDVWTKLERIGDHVSRKYTRIYNRLDWHLAALLTWCSPIRWRFPSDTDYQRGWLNTLAVGDSQTGKSEVAIQLRKLFNCGVFVSGENCTFVGLVGGAIKVGSGQLMLRWGRIPLSDKQLVVLEELSGLSVEEISNMSDVRSSGTARLDKGGINAETNSRTRLLCLSNARSTKKSLSQYLFGIHAVQELIGHGEDIARFDLITTLTDREVPIDVINSAHFATITNDEDIASDQFRKLVHFIWSLGPDQIKFSPSAYEACLDETKRLAAIYHPSIPVFKGGSGRYKVGRIAAAIACLQFAWDGRVVVVEQAHVEAATKLLELIFNKESFGYRQYSRQMFDRENVKDATLLRKVFKKRIPRSTLPKVLETLIHCTRFTVDELCAIASISRIYADAILGTMIRERAIKKGEANVYDITPAGKIFLEKFLHGQTSQEASRT